LFRNGHNTIIGVQHISSGLLQNGIWHCEYRHQTHVNLPSQFVEAKHSQAGLVCFFDKSTQRVFTEGVARNGRCVALLHYIIQNTLNIAACQNVGIVVHIDFHLSGVRQNTDSECCPQTNRRRAFDTNEFQ